MSKKPMHITCLAEVLKGSLLTALKAAPGVAGDLVESMESFPLCDRGTLIGLPKKRKASAYQEFASKCMRGLDGPVTERMKLCSERWRAQK